MQSAWCSAWGLFVLLMLAGCTLGEQVTHHPSEQVDDEGVLLMEEAKALMEAEDYSQARAKLLELTTRDPAYFRGHRALQEAILQAEGANAVLDMAKQAVEVERSALTLTLLARLKKDPKEGIRLLKEALDLDTTYVWAYYGIAYYYLQAMNAEDYEKARRKVETALQYDSRFQEAQLLLIETLDRVGEDEEEAQQYGIYIESHPDDLDARYNYADLLRSKLDENEDALEQLELVLAKDPARMDAQLLKGVVLSQSGDYEKAEQLFLKLSHSHPNALLNLAFLYRDYMDEPEKALSCFAQYLNYAGPSGNDKTFFDRKILVPNYMEELKKELQ
jgi:tetratricopeptide (TPR) repeat protein